jgi:hypothetical protein
MSSDLAAWLLEQIAEDERQLLDGDPAHQWHSGGCHAWMSAANRPCSCISLRKARPCLSTPIRHAEGAASVGTRSPEPLT